MINLKACMARTHKINKKWASQQVQKVHRKDVYIYVYVLKDTCVVAYNSIVSSPPTSAVIQPHSHAVHLQFCLSLQLTLGLL